MHKKFFFKNLTSLIFDCEKFAFNGLKTINTRTTHANASFKS